MVTAAGPGIFVAQPGDPAQPGRVRNPDFGLFARAFGVRHWGVDSDTGLEQALREALDAGEPGLVEVRLRER